MDVPAPEIVRSALRQTAAVDQIHKTDARDSEVAHGRADNKGSAGNTERNKPQLTSTASTTANIFHPGDNSDEELAMLPMPWENKTENPNRKPLTAGTGPPKPVMVTDTMEEHMASAPSARSAPGTSEQPKPNMALLMGCPCCSARISKRANQCPKCKSAPYDNCQICSTSILVNSDSCQECGDPDPFNS